MLDTQANSTTWIPGRVFYVGLAVVLLATWIPFIPGWTTFIHMWRVEVASSIFLIAVLGYLLATRKTLLAGFDLHQDEWRFIVLPILLFVGWSSLSVLWAPSWKSAVHHSLIWAEYLAFYFIFRQVAANRDSRRSLILVVVSTLLLYAAPAIVEYCAFLSFGGATTIGMRFAKYGEQVITILPLALIAVLKLSGQKLRIGFAAIMLLWLLVYCSFGRINYLLFATVIISVFLALWISRRYRSFVPRYALLLLVLVLAPLPFSVFSLSSDNAAASAPVLSRINDSEGMASSNNFRKLMYSVGGEMIAANPILGVGADNFGMQANRYREAYGANNPNDVNLASAEDQIPQHAHNELLQIVTELGLVGGVIFAWFLAGIALMAIRSVRTLRSGSLTGFAAVLGMGMFLASSLVSAYSFRVMQNGIVFFVVLAIASTKLFAGSKEESPGRVVVIPQSWLRPAAFAGIAVCLGLITYSAVRVSSVIVTARANQTKTIDAAMPLYELAMRLDDENPDVRQNLGMRLFRTKRYGEAVPYLQSAVAIGRAPSPELSYLATAQALNGDTKGAEQTLASAAALYPRSPFVLARYAALLEDNGRTADASVVFSRAMGINERAAATWQVLIASGPKALSDKAARDERFSQVMDLQPKSSIYAVVTERLIRFPEDRKYSFAKLTDEEE